MCTVQAGDLFQTFSFLYLCTMCTLSQLQMAGKLELSMIGYQVLSGENDCVPVSCVDLRSSPVRPAWLWPEQKVSLTTDTLVPL